MYVDIDISVSLNWPQECGPPIAESERELTEIDAKLEKIDAKINDLKAAAEQSGIRLLDPAEV